jgi:hypothetical protein
MALPNSEKITSQLASMPDQALKQMAMMHKADPYILPLIISEDGRRKRTRQAAQAQMTQMQQPKVADAAVAQMGALPEDQGIAQLPTPNMQNMADGGIAGYDDNQFDFTQRSEPVVRMADGGYVPRYQGVPTAMGGDGSLVKSSLQKIEEANIAALGPLAQQFKQAEQQFIAAAKSGDQQAIAQYMQAKEVLRKQLEETVASKFGNQAPKVLNQLLSSDSAAPAASAAPVVPIASDTAKTPAAPAVAANAAPAAPTKKPPVKETSAAPRPQGAPGASSGQGIQSIYELFAGDKNKRDIELNEIQERIRQQGTAETSSAQQQLNRLKEDITAQGAYGKDREAKLKAREERIGKEEGKAGGLALLEAGLAMMSGTSANAFANIGQGALAGTAAYRKSLDKIADAKDKLEDAYGRLEDVRFNQTSMNNSEIRKATADVDKATNSGLKSLTDFAVTRYGMSREDAKTMFTGAMQERVANIGAGATRYSADRRSADNKDYINAVKGSGAIEQARKNVMEQVMKANKYGTPEEIQTQFEAEWKKTLHLNPELAKLAGTSGGGSTPVGGADFVLNPQTGKLEPRK